MVTNDFVLFHERPEEDNYTKTLRSGGGRWGKVGDEQATGEPGLQTSGAPGTGMGTDVETKTGTGKGTGTVAGTGTGTGTGNVAKWERYVFILSIHHY